MSGDTPVTILSVEKFKALTSRQLKEKAKELSIAGWSRMKKEELSKAVAMAEEARSKPDVEMPSIPEPLKKKAKQNGLEMDSRRSSSLPDTRGRTAPINRFAKRFRDKGKVGADGKKACACNSKMLAIWGIGLVTGIAAGYLLWRYVLKDQGFEEVALTEVPTA